MDTKQKLGIKVFYYYLSNKIVAGVIFLVISFIVSSSKVSLVSKLSLVLPKEMSFNAVLYLVNGLFILSVFLIILGIFLSWLHYISCNFILGDNNLTIIHGILNKKEVSIPYRQIENINIEQSFNFKLMGICKLKIETAGNNSINGGKPEGYFDVIDFKIAQKIRDFILQNK